MNGLIGGQKYKQMKIAHGIDESIRWKLFNVFFQRAKVLYLEKNRTTLD